MFKTTPRGFMATLARTLAAALLATTPVLAGPADTQAALSACVGGYPTPAAISKGLTGAGFVLDGEMGGMLMYLSADGKTVAGTKGSADTGVRCILMEDRLTPRKAAALADALAARMPGHSALTPPSKEVTVLFSGMLNNKLTNVFVAKSFSFGKIAGAALLVEAQ